MWRRSRRSREVRISRRSSSGTIAQSLLRTTTMNRFVRAFGRITSRILVGILVVSLIWFAANRLFDERPDPQRAAFVSPPEEPIPDKQNIAVGIVGLGA